MLRVMRLNILWRLVGFRSVYKVIHHGKRDVMVANDRVMLKHVYIKWNKKLQKKTCKLVCELLEMQSEARWALQIDAGVLGHAPA